MQLDIVIDRDRAARRAEQRGRRVGAGLPIVGDVPVGVRLGDHHDPLVAIDVDRERRGAARTKRRVALLDRELEVLRADLRSPAGSTPPGRSTDTWHRGESRAARTRA